MPALIPESDTGDTLAAHIAAFNALAQKLDAAVQAKNEGAIASTQQDLDLFFGQLDGVKQREIRIFLEQQKAGKTIQNYRDVSRGRVHQIMDALVGTVKATADTVPQLAEETLRLVIATVGHLGAGVWKGGVSTVRSFQQAA